MSRDPGPRMPDPATIVRTVEALTPLMEPFRAEQRRLRAEGSIELADVYGDLDALIQTMPGERWNWLGADVARIQQLAAYLAGDPTANMQARELRDLLKPCSPGTV